MGLPSTPLRIPSMFKQLVHKHTDSMAELILVFDANFDYNRKFWIFANNCVVRKKKGQLIWPHKLIEERKICRFYLCLGTYFWLIYMKSGIFRAISRLHVDRFWWNLGQSFCFSENKKIYFGIWTKVGEEPKICCIYRSLSPKFFFSEIFF